MRQGLSQALLHTPMSQLPPPLLYMMAPIHSHSPDPGEGPTLRMTGSSVVVTVWKMRLMLRSGFSLRVVMRSKALS